MRTSIRDKIALVTGASRGIGRASALALGAFRNGGEVRYTEEKGVRCIGSGQA